MSYLNNKNIFDFFGVIFILTVTIVSLSYNIECLNAPFVGYHPWRCAQTYGVTRNLLEIDFNFFKPRYDIIVNNPSGYYPGEFPFYNLISAFFLKITGISIFNARLFSFILTLLTSFFLFLSVLKLKKSFFLATSCLSIFIISDIVTLQSFSIMPEVMILFLYAFIIWLIVVRNFIFNIKTCLLLSVFLTIGTLVKPSFYPIVLFTIPFWFSFNLKKLNWYYFVMILSPIFVMYLWKSFTMTFEHITYGTTYPLTHHYSRNLSTIIEETTIENIFYSFQKVDYALGRGIVYFLYLLLFLYSSMAIITLLNKKISFREFLEIEISKFNLHNINNKTILGLLLWTSGSLFFLVAAGNIQTHQIYYAAPLAIPLILLLILISWSLKLEYLFIFLIPFQIFVHNIPSIKYMMLDSKDSWVHNDLEKECDNFSTRKDFFIATPFWYADFTGLGQVGRRGMNALNLNDIVSHKEIADFVYVSDTSKISEEMKVFLDTQNLVLQRSNKKIFRLVK